MDRSYIPPAPSKEEVEALVRTVNLREIRNTVLQSICIANGVPKTGNKIDLQRRLAKLINDSATDGHEFYTIRESIRAKTGLSLPPPPAPPKQPPPAPPPTQPSYYSPAEHRAAAQYVNAMPSSYMSGTYLPTNGLRQGHSAPTSTPSPSSLAWPRSSLTILGQPYAQSFVYKPSPFHEILCRLSDLKTIQVMPQHRNSVTVTLKAHDNSLLQQCATDSRHRVLVFCAAGNEGEQDIAFPHASELKVNGGEFKCNMRGLKNKPGSTRPVDITPSLRLKPPSYINTVEFTYAMTQKTYYFGVYVCKTTSVEDLVARIRQKIVKSQTIALLTKGENDDDVVATSTNLSLKCPLSAMRIKNPCRSISCPHAQCFDATSYLQLQEQGPTWTCPICNRSAPYDHLAIDEYFMEIIKGTPDDLEQVSIAPDGKWLQPGTAQKSTRSESASLLDGDDELYISDMFTTPTARTSTPRGPVGTLGTQHYLGTPSNSGSRGSSTVPKSSASNKRPVSEVIDLTLSSDDEEPSRPAKRTNYGGPGDDHYY